jgi:hypothetical protein
MSAGCRGREKPVATLKQLSNKMRLLSRQIPVNVKRGLHQTVLAIDQILVTSTPVDTGRARSNWIVGAGPSNRIIDAYVPNSGSGSAEGALRQARAFLDSTDVSVIYISNNLDYIQYLNEGTSAQAPAGFIEAAVAEGRRYVQNMRVT